MTDNYQERGDREVPQSLRTVPMFAAPHAPIAGVPPYPATPTAPTAPSLPPVADGAAAGTGGVPPSMPPQTSHTASDPTSTAGPRPFVVPDPPGGRKLNWEGVDWALVRELKTAVSEQLKDKLGAEASDEDYRQAARSFIRRLLRDRFHEALASGERPLDQRLEREYSDAIFHSIFGLGRLQPLLEDAEVENVIINGHDRVLLKYGDGRVVEAPPVAESDAELVKELEFIASWAPSGARPFSRVHWELNIALEEWRLHAVAYDTTYRPSVTIRHHRFPDPTMDTLVELGVVDEGMADFLTAAVRAHKTVVVAGDGGAGKTTVLRALASCLLPAERIVTVETDFELYLHRFPQRHPDVVAMQEREGGIPDADGRSIGAVKASDYLRAAQRQSADRIIVGEVRGGEIIAMFNAMSTSNGSMSTVHGKSAQGSVASLVNYATSVTGNPVYSAHEVGEHIDLLVHIQRVDDRYRGGGFRRHVSEILELQPKDGATRPAHNTLWAPQGPDRKAVFRMHPSFVEDLVYAGYRPDKWGYTTTTAEARWGQ